MPAGAETAQSAVRMGVAFILAGMTAISINDMAIKTLSAGYALHQIVFVRSLFGLCFNLVFLQFEGGFAALRTAHPWLHALRGVMIVAANMAFFAALAVIPLAETTALFFVAPLFITLLSVPVLGERVGSRRLGAVLVGFLGVLVMLRPWGGLGGDVSRWVLLLPVGAALCYAVMQVLTRWLGVSSRASAMAIYLQATFLAVSVVFWAVAGDGRYVDAVTHESLQFLLRAWTWPAAEDWPFFLLIGAMSAIVSYSLGAAYRSADAAVIAPFEYVALPLAIFWGFVVFGEVPGPWVLAAIALIAGAGLYVFLRERARDRPPSARRVGLRR